VRLVVLWLDHGGGIGAFTLLGAAALLPLGILAIEPPEHIRVRLRRFADLIESVGVIALFPLAVGVFGIYGQLLDKF
jgi:hypothetical protein